MVNNADLCDNQVEALFMATYSLIEGLTIEVSLTTNTECWLLNDVIVSD